MTAVVVLTVQPEQVPLGSVGKADNWDAIIIRYPAAPVTEDQVKVGSVEPTLAPSPGEIKTGNGALPKNVPKNDVAFT